MELIESFIPEAEVKEKYYTNYNEHCTFYIQWFHYADDKGKPMKERFADVYVSKDCNIDFRKRFERKNIPIRTVPRVNNNSK